MKCDAASDIAAVTLTACCCGARGPTLVTRLWCSPPPSLDTLPGSLGGACGATVGKWNAEFGACTLGLTGCGCTTLAECVWTGRTCPAGRTPTAAG